MSTLPDLMSPAQSLAHAWHGTLHLPGGDGYERARHPWNVAVDQRPAAVAVPRHPDDLARLVIAAGDHGLRLAPQSTGHNAGPLAAQGLDDVVLVDMTAFDGVEIDPVARIARVGAGVIWDAVVAAASPHGLAALHGSSPDVGVAGFALGGGIGWYSRRHGLAADHVRAIELVTPSGDHVRTDAETYPDLFWAMRGGGGGFGIATAFELELEPIATAYAGMLLWDRERAPEVLETWAAWTRGVPDEVTTSVRVMSFPPIPELPELVRGRQLVVVDGAILAEDADAERILAPLRALAPEVDTFARIPARDVVRIHMDPEQPTPGVSASVMLDAFDLGAIEAMLDQVGPGRATPILSAEIRHLGGALARRRPGCGALGALAGQYVGFFVAVAPFPAAAEAGAAATRALADALEPWSTGGRYLNFEEGPVDASRAFDAATHARLAALRRSVDERGILVPNHAI